MTFSIDRFSHIKNPYHVLEVPQTAKQSEIKKAYRAKARVTHPDRNPSWQKETWEKRFQEIQKAYEILGDQKTRKDYDEYLKTQKADVNTDFDNFSNKTNSSSDARKSEIAKEKWYEVIKTQNEQAKNFRSKWTGSRKKRIWIYTLAGIILTICFGLIMPSTHGSGNVIPDTKNTQIIDWQNIVDNPQGAYCDPVSGEQIRYCFYQNVFYTFDSNDGVHWYGWINSQAVPVDLSSIPTYQTDSNNEAYSNAMGYHFCLGKRSNYLVFENCLQLQTSLVNR
jgi:curved DNA-binding protein CbpA